MFERKVCLLLLALMVVTIWPAATAFAGGTLPPTPEPLHNGAVSPNYHPSSQDIQAIQMKEESLRAAIDYKYQSGFDALRGDSRPHFAAPPIARGITPKYYHSRVLPLEKEWKEPNDYAHRNYCGPGATQVALDARLPKYKVPDIDTIGAMEKINPSWGVTMDNVAATLNQILRSNGDLPNSNGFVAYELAYPNNMWSLFNYIDWDIQRGYATISGVKTTYMPGWDGRRAYHIVAIYGIYYDNDYNNYYKYAETASPKAGYNGPFAQWAYWRDFYDYYSGNKVISW
ncbi:MAG: hypothetical protein D6732_09020 [Methanobacteriota archaeon]|nr:MAG: hypothetical protein D6732_09020 [Euryarchaeota archaeon]